MHRNEIPFCGQKARAVLRYIFAPSNLCGMSFRSHTKDRLLIVTFYRTEKWKECQFILQGFLQARSFSCLSSHVLTLCKNMWKVFSLLRLCRNNYAAVG